MVKIVSYIKHHIEYIVFIVLLLMLIYVLSNRYFENFFTEQHGINRLDAIIYINLENRADRKDLLLKELETLNTNMSKVHKISGVYIPKNGHKGCIQSHILALNMCKLNNWDRVLILEDDAQLTTSPEIFNNIINKTLDYLDTLDATKKNSTHSTHSTQQTSEDMQINNVWDVIMLATANKIISNTKTYNKTLDIDIPITPEQEQEQEKERKQSQRMGTTIIDDVAVDIDFRNAPYKVLIPLFYVLNELWLQILLEMLLLQLPNLHHQQQLILNF